jgi:acetate kinase
MGVHIGDDLNRRAVGDALISCPGAAVSVLVVTARKEAAIARAVQEFLRGP